MSCWSVGKSGVLQQVQVDMPIISNPQELLIQVQAASINPIDVHMQGGYGRNVLGAMRQLDALAESKITCNATTDEQPLVVGRDFAGVVVSCGRGVRGLDVGQRVMGVISPYKALGSHAPYVLAHKDNVVLCPPSLSSTECASVPYAALTGYSAAVVSGCHGDVGALQGIRVMVAGAAGGVGVSLVQMLQAWGAQVVGVCSLASFELLSSLGVLEFYDYQDNDAMQALTMERSFDLVLDASGCRDLRYLECLKTNRNASYVSLLSPLLKNTDAHGLLLGVAKSALELVQLNSSSLGKGRLVKWGYYSPSKQALAQIRDMMQRGQLKPVLDQVFPYSEAKAAYEHMQHGKHAGKTVLDMTV
uniref:Reticulon-4-interacting protein 1 n=1 Tax=Hirondellea gigas TaxID=1518452 RepID=A0A2P2HYW4_9CRUS